MRKNILVTASAVICALFFMFIVMFQAFLPSAYAAANGKIILNCKINDVALDKMSWSAYFAAERNSEGKFVAAGKFSSYPVELNNLTDSQLQDCADTLENYVNTDNISADSQGVSDKNGIADINISKPGVYLLCGNYMDYNGKRYLPSPMLIEFTQEDFKVPLNVYPKFEIEDITGGKTNFSVVKKWVGDENHLRKRPEFIKAEIYMDGELYDTITLNESNNWSFGWNADDNHEWFVKEINVSKYYKVVYKKSDENFEIINKYDSSGNTEGEGDDDSSSSPDESSGSGSDSQPDGSQTDGDSDGGGQLPQTGQLWWPVPLLAVGGLVCVAIGVRMGKKNKNEKK